MSGAVHFATTVTEAQALSKTIRRKRREYKPESREVNLRFDGGSKRVVVQRRSDNQQLRCGSPLACHSNRKASDVTRTTAS